MATKVKPCRIQATGTPQVGYVPKYVDEDTFQWGTGGGGSDIVYATQAEYNALLPGAASDGKHYFIYSTDGGGGWQLGVNTVAYYPLTSTSTVNDMSGNSRNLTNGGGVTFGTYHGISCANITGNSDSSHQNSKYLYGDITGFPTGAGQRTYNFWIYQDNQATSQNAVYIVQGTAEQNKIIAVLQGRDFSGNVGLTSYGYGSGTTSPIIGERHNIIITYSGSTFSYYVNGEEKINWAQTVDTSSSLISIGGTSQEANTWSSFNGCFSSLILEDKVRTAQEVSDYYNQTKGDYGIS